MEYQIHSHCISGKSFCNQRLVNKRLIRVGDLITDGNQFIFHCNSAQLDFSPREAFDLMDLTDAILYHCAILEKEWKRE